MMTTTHAVMGVALTALALARTGAPASASAVLAAAFLGGAVPDLDLLGVHRKTLHFPVLLPLAAGAAGLWAAASGSTAGVLAVAFLGSAALHSAVDVLGGGVEPEPWTRTSDEAVYNHVLGRWHEPKRWVRYAGAPEDFALTAAFGAVAVASSVTSPRFDRLLIAVVLFSAAFALFRKRLPELGEYAGAVLRR